MRLTSTSPLSRERQVEPQLGAARRRRSAPASRGRAARRRRRRPRTARRRAGRASPGRSPPRRSAAPSAPGRARTPRARRPAAPAWRSRRPAKYAADLGGEDAVRDHRVGEEAVEREVGERAARLVDDEPLRRQHEPDADALVVAQHLVHRDQRRARRAARPRARPRSAGRGRTGARRRPSGSAAGTPCRATSARRRGTTAAAASRRSARSRRRSPRRRPASCWRPISSRPNSSSMPGRTVSSSAAIRSTPLRTSSSPSQSCTADQWRSSSSCALTCCASSPGATGAGCGPTAAPRTSARLCAGSVETSSVRRPGGAQAPRGRGGDRRLADAALARVEDRPRCHRGEDTPRDRVLSPRAPGRPSAFSRA